MHALNHFLINIDDTDDIIVQDGRIFATEHGAFATYVEDKFDENNWHTPLSLTIKGGDTVISTDEYRGGFDAWIGDRDSWDFDKATEAAYAALYHDINRDLNMLTNSEYAYDREFESIEQAADIIRQSLAISYSGNDDGIEDWKLSARPRLARTYENLTDKYFTPPFFNAWDVNPYNARTFDLTDGEDYGLAILTVDVHT